MSLLTPADQERLRADFAAMSRPVTVLLFTQHAAAEACGRTRRVLEELPELSANIHLRDVSLEADADTAAQYGVDRAPAVVLTTITDEGAGRDSGIRFLGTPSGYEFVSLVRAILLVGGGAPTLSEANLQRLARINSPTTIHVFSTPTCPQCPRAVTLAHEIAWANPFVTAYAVEATGMPDLTRQYRVTGVPKTVINDVVEILGAVPEDDFIGHTLAGFDARYQETAAP